MKNSLIFSITLMLAISLSSCQQDCHEASIVNFQIAHSNNSESSLSLPSATDIYGKEIIVTYDKNTNLTSKLILLIKNPNNSFISNKLVIPHNFTNNKGQLTLLITRGDEFLVKDTENHTEYQVIIPEGRIKGLKGLNFELEYTYWSQRKYRDAEPLYTCEVDDGSLRYGGTPVPLHYSFGTDDTSGNTGGNSNKGSTGTLSLSPNAPEVGDDITISVADSDLNTVETTKETVVVTATSDKGEKESITLTETGVNTGVFEATVSTIANASAGTNNDGSFSAENNTKITATYDDALDANGNDPAPISASVTLTQPAPAFTFTDFLGKKVIHDSTITYNGTAIDPTKIASVSKGLSVFLPDASSGCGSPTPPAGQCYGFEYQLINQSTNKFDVYYNTDFNYCNCATNATPAFSNEFTYSGNTVSINSGTGFENWTLTVKDKDHFTLHIISGGGSQVTERYYSVKK